MTNHYNSGYSAAAPDDGPEQNTQCPACMGDRPGARGTGTCACQWDTLLFVSPDEGGFWWEWDGDSLSGWAETDVLAREAAVAAWQRRIDNYDGPSDDEREAQAEAAQERAVRERETLIDAGRITR